jgi:hypothetical protein
MDNMKFFSEQEIVSAEKALSLQAAPGYPSNTDMNWILKLNQIQECPVNPDDAKNATEIWGADIPSLKGKTTHKTPEHVPTDRLKSQQKYKHYTK